LTVVSFPAFDSLLNLTRQLLWTDLMCLSGLGAMPGRRPYLCRYVETDTCLPVAAEQRTADSPPSVESNLNSERRSTMMFAKEAEAFACAEPGVEESLLRN
jgi:hypothetical protein